METKLAIDLISKTFSFPFNEENFKEIIIESLNGIESNEKIINLTNLPSNILEKTEAIKTVGKYNDKNGVGILVVVVTFKEKRYLEQTRNIQREIASKIMDSAGFDNILAAFIAKGHVNWRYSLIQSCRFVILINCNHNCSCTCDLNKITLFSKLSLCINIYVNRNRCST